MQGQSYFDIALIFNILCNNICTYFKTEITEITEQLNQPDSSIIRMIVFDRIQIFPTSDRFICI